MGTGAGSLPAGLDSGQLAKWASNASFATLTLIYSFTQILDLASQFSTLAGVTLRVGQLLQVSLVASYSLHLCATQGCCGRSTERPSLPITEAKPTFGICCAWCWYSCFADLLHP